MMKKRYKITGFIDEGENIRILLSSSDLVKKKNEVVNPLNIMSNPMGFAQTLAENSMNKMKHDSFVMTLEEYKHEQLFIGDMLIVEINRE